MFSAATFDFPILSETSTVCSLANNAQVRPAGHRSVAHFGAQSL
jgi:hypothetical protein